MLRHFLAVFTSILVILPACGAQSAAGQEPLFRSTTRLVELSVVASDSKGQALQGLTKEDFTVLEDGKPVQVAHFSQPGLERFQPRAPLPKGVYTNRPELLPHAPKSVTAIVLDYLNSGWANQMAAREQVLMVLRMLGPEDEVALYSMGQTLRILHDFTTDRRSLEERLLRSPGWLVNTRMESELLQAHWDRWDRSFEEPRMQAEWAQAAVQARTRMSLTMNSLSLIARHLAGVPGRRNLVWMSDGFAWGVMPVNTTTPKVTNDKGGFRVDNMPSPESALGGAEASLFTKQMDRTVRAISDAGVAVYSVNTSGLLVPMAGASDSGGAMQLMKLPGTRASSGDRQASLLEVASRTGGVAMLPSNDMTRGFRMVLEDARNAYVLAFYPANEKADGRFRKLEVRVNRAGAKVRHRPGYTADDLDRAQSQKKPDLEEAASSPISQSSVLLTAQASTGEQGEMKLVLQIEPRQVSFQRAQDGWAATLDLAFFQRTDAGKMNGTQITLPLQLSEESYQSVLKKGLIYRKSFEPEKGAKSLRVVVRDSLSGAIGTLEIPFRQE